MDWTKVVFTDVTQFNLDEPEGLYDYWHDLRTSPDVLSKRQRDGGSVMVWGGIFNSGIIRVVEVVISMNLREYVRNLERGLPPIVGSIVGEIWFLLQDNASVHSSKHTENGYRSKSFWF